MFKKFEIARRKNIACLLEKKQPTKV